MTLPFESRRSTLIFSSALFTVSDQRRRGPSKGWGPEVGGFPPLITLTRCGVYACVAGDETVVTDPLNAKYYDGEHSFRFRRLADGGEDLTVIIPDISIIDELFVGFGYQTPISPELYLAHIQLYNRLRSGLFDTLSAEEAILELLYEVVRSAGGAGAPARINPVTRKRLDNARAFVAVEPEADHHLAEVAQVAGASPFHFARLFKAHTGHSLRAYRLRLRLAKAVERISQGDDDLAGLALDSGFSHQSHMTAAFRKVLSTTPDAVRRSLHALN